MNSFERICLYYVRAFKRYQPIVLSLVFNTVLDVEALIIAIFISNRYLYPVIIIVLGDLIKLAAYGAWHCAPAHNKKSSQNPATSEDMYNPILIKAICLIPMLICAYNSFGDRAGINIAIASTFCYVAVFANTMDTMRRILLTMYRHNESWLAGTEGNIGLANWFSIIRIAAAVILPHLFLTRPYGRWSLVAEIVTLGICIITDAIDGRVARKNHSETRAGRYLDPLGDKVLFVPLSIVFALMSFGFNLDGNQACFGAITVCCTTVATVRDVLFFIWFFTLRKRIRTSIKAGFVDKVRMVLICAWLGAMALAFTFQDLGRESASLLMVKISFVLVILVAVISILSIYTDTRRIRKQKMMDYDQDFI